MEGLLTDLLAEAPTAGALIVVVWMFLKDRKRADESRERAEKAVAEAIKAQTVALTELRVALVAWRTPPIPFPSNPREGEKR